MPGRRHCGLLERILHRQWAPDEVPPPQILVAVDRLAELPQLIKERLVAGLDAIYIGPGAVPDLDDMSSLSGVQLPSGRATWDACAGAYGERKVIVGSRPSPTPDVMCHEIGHALDDIDGSGEHWQSDSDDFRKLYTRCLSAMTGESRQQVTGLGRREFFADAFAAIASGQRPALVEMVGGDTGTALMVMLYFNVRYGIQGGSAMYVMRLPNGNLLVPESATAHDGRIVSDAYVEIGPADPDYERLAAGALTEDEMEERAKRWREGDQPLRRQFLDFLARGGQ